MHKHAEPCRSPPPGAGRRCSTRSRATRSARPLCCWTSTRRRRCSQRTTHRRTSLGLQGSHGRRVGRGVRHAMAGRCEARPKLAVTAIPLVVHVPTPDRRSGGRAAGRVPGARGERGYVPPAVRLARRRRRPAARRRPGAVPPDGTHGRRHVGRGVDGGRGGLVEALTAAGGEGLVVNTDGEPGAGPAGAARVKISRTEVPADRLRPRQPHPPPCRISATRRAGYDDSPCWI